MSPVDEVPVRAAADLGFPVERAGLGGRLAPLESRAVRLIADLLDADPDGMAESAEAFAYVQLAEA